MSTPLLKTASGVLTDDLMARLTRVFSAYAELESVTLFGSHALGTASPRSDIDLATRGIRDRHTLGRLILDLEDLDLPQDCDTKAFEEIRYRPLRRHIEAVGVTIYSRRGRHDPGSSEAPTAGNAPTS